MIILYFSIDEQIGAFAVLSFLPIVLIFIGEGTSEALSLYISDVEGIDETVIELEPLS